MMNTSVYTLCPEKSGPPK